MNKEQVFSNGLIDILDWGNLRGLYSADMCQGVINKDTKSPASDYMIYLQKALEPHKTILCIGAGGCILPTALNASGKVVDVVDNDPDMFNLAKEYFWYKQSGEHFIQDGFQHLKNSTKKYDAIVIDAYDGFERARSLYYQPAYEAAARLLLDGNSQLFLNFICRTDLEIELHETLLKGVFGEVGYHKFNPIKPYQVVLFGGQ